MLPSALVGEGLACILALRRKGGGSWAEGVSQDGREGSSPRDNEERLDAPSTAV